MSHRIKTGWASLASASLLAACLVGAATPAQAAGGWSAEGVAWMAPASGGVEVHRLYNPYTGQHHYTIDAQESEDMTSAGWRYEKVAFHASESGAPVYRVYNPYNGQHHYTLDESEYHNLVSSGWHDEQVAWHVDTAASMPIYRVYNPYSSEHLFTADKAEYDSLSDIDATTRLASTVLDGLTRNDSILPGYDRDYFGEAWVDVDGNGCGTRDDILARDLTEVTKRDKCVVQSGTLADPYTGQTIDFVKGAGTGRDGGVQIDHVVALSNAWKTGAKHWDDARRLQFANDPYNLLAVDDQANQDKSDASADEWLPSNTAFQCEYVARQVGVKSKYGLWVTSDEYSAMSNILASCPTQEVPAGVGVTAGVSKPSQPSQPSEPSRPSEPSLPSQPTVSYKNCTEVWNAIGRPLYRGEPGYAPHLDRDNDGIACETRPR